MYDDCALKGTAWYWRHKWGLDYETQGDKKCRHIEDILEVDWVRNTIKLDVGLRKRISRITPGIPP